MMIVLCILLCLAGHIVRDGWPSYKMMLGGLVGGRLEWLYHLSTHLARVSGAVLCGIGGGLVGGWSFGAMAGTAVLAGFYIDMKHGEGQGADTTASYAYLALSGVTSIAVLVGLLAWLGNPWLSLWLLAGFTKPPIWILAWKYLRNIQATWFQPTRVAAGVFGAVVGAIIAFGSLQCCYH